MRPAITPLALSIMSAIAFNTLFAAPSYEQRPINNPASTSQPASGIVFSDFPEFLQIDCNESDWYDVTATSDCPPVEIWINDIEVPGECPSSYTIIREFNAEDFCGNQATAIQTIVVEDWTPPVLSVSSQNINWPCNQFFDFDDYFGEIQAWDNCGVANSISISYQVLPGSCPFLSVENYLIMAVDECGNSTVVEVNVQFIDDNPPHEFSYSINSGQHVGYVEIFESGGETEIFVAEVEDVVLDIIDDCSDSYAVFLGEDWFGNVLSQYYNLCDMCQNCTYHVLKFHTPTFGCTDPCAINYNLAANEDDGSCEYPSFSPFFTFFTSELSIGCMDYPDFEIEFPEVESECEYELLVDVTEIPGGCPGNLTRVEIFTLNDACCNSIDSTRVVYVTDDEPPVVNGEPSVVVDFLDDVYITATDECSEPVEIEYSEDFIGSNGEYLSYERTYTVCDACLNCLDFIQTVHLKDPFSSILETNNAGMMVFPNPVKEILQIDLQASNCGANSWEIHDIAGKRLYQAEFADNLNVFTIDSSAWEAGVYLLTVYCGEQRITSKVVKL